MNLRIIGNDIVTRNTHFNGACVFEISENDLNQDVRLPGSLLFANNRIWVAIDTTQAMIRAHDNTAKSPATGKIHILGNQVIQCECSTTQPFLDISVTDMEELMVLNNILPPNVSLGAADGGSFGQFKAMNVIGGQSHLGQQFGRLIVEIGEIQEVRRGVAA